MCCSNTVGHLFFVVRIMPVIFVILWVAFDFLLRTTEKFASGVITAADC